MLTLQIFLLLYAPHCLLTNFFNVYYSVHQEKKKIVNKCKRWNTFVGILFSFPSVHSGIESIEYRRNKIQPIRIVNETIASLEFVRCLQL